MQSTCGPLDSSQFLRDILHTKASYKSQLKASNAIYSSDCSSEMISPLLHSKSSDMAYNSRDNDNDLDNENDDIEIATDNNSCINDGDQSDDLDERSLDATTHDDVLKSDELQMGDSKEAKRAHVDNILTSMRQSPHQDTMDSSGSILTGDVKRQKRKQPQPQQHESSVLHSEELAIQRQIQHLQEQMQAVKRKREEEDLCGSLDDDTEDEVTSKPSSPVNGETKRARVEHILSSMRSGSPRLDNGYDYTNGISPGSECGKRQKRKQTQPQQHDNSKSDTIKHNNNNQSFGSKNLNVNDDTIPADDPVNENNNTNGLFGPDPLFRNSLYRGLGEKEFLPPFHNGFDPQFYRDNLFRHSFFMRPDLETMALRHATKALQSRHDLGLLTDGQQRPSPVDLTKIANALKAELTQAVNKAIESAVTKVLTDKQLQQQSETPSHTDLPQHPDRNPPQPKHQRPPSALPHFMHQHQQQIHHHQQQQQHQQHHHQPHQPLPVNPLPERESLKESGNNSDKKPELIVPFSEHLHFLERFGNRLQQDKLSAFEPHHKGESELITPHTGPSLPFPPHFPYYLSSQVLPPLYTGEPEQTEALPLIVNTPKKKRTKVTDTRLSSPRGKPGLLQDNTPSSSMDHNDAQRHLAAAFPHFLPPVLPTSVAITNPSLSHSDLLALRLREASYADSRIPSPQDHSRSSPRSPSDSPHYMSSMYDRSNMSDMMDGSSPGVVCHLNSAHTTTLTPMHLRKAKLMFFYTRYPSSSILKLYFPDVSFNKNNTAQLVKWFSNFREFFYIQMEKFARQALAEGCKHAEDLVVTMDSELFRHLNLHYNRNNQIEVPHNFLAAVQAALKEFFKSIQSNKDAEPSWKKAIYKIIARMDETLPDFFKSPNWMEQLGDQ
ncbi:uncharacterized protein LOC131946236 [Physella acuta]|uniref:uncharacterized protein LOC131946236 n=1 Tax=Physella acuta TaxID=109671 RepID=UPI0027DC1C1F|nr:uncharacterized protein LOC131946236 [Physella acuta]